MAKVIVFGTQDFASLAHFYLRHDSEHEVVAFSVTREFLDGRDSFEDKPLVAFEDVEKRFPPSSFQFFVPMSHRKMSHLRADIFGQVKGKGYRCISYVSSHATTFPGTPIGENCFILEDNTIQPFTRIGDDVVLWSGNHIGHHSRIADHAFFTSHVVLSGHCEVGSHSFFGVNATIRDRVTIAPGTLVAMGAVITNPTEAWGVYKGNPARKADVSSKDLDF
jgi:sugar O-acyltransferase (sialic acid O-acetyltransferase NeuD family)